MTLQTEEAAEDALRDAFPDASVHVAWRVGALAQMSVDNDSVVRGSFEDALAWLIAHRKAARIVAAAPAPVVAPLPEPAPVPVFVPEPAPDMRDVELAAARAEIEFLKKCIETLQEPAPLLPAPDALMSDYGPVGMDDITGDLLLDAFEENEAETAAVIQVLSATRQRHLSEQLNVEKARLRREHMLTDQANPREASIDRLLGLLTRRGD